MRVLVHRPSGRVLLGASNIMTEAPIDTPAAFFVKWLGSSFRLSSFGCVLDPVLPAPASLSLQPVSSDCKQGSPNKSWPNCAGQIPRRTSRLAPLLATGDVVPAN